MKGVSIIIIIYSLRVFHNSASWFFFFFFFSWVWVTTSLLKSPGFFSVFRPFVIMLSFWIVFTRPPTSESSRPYNNLLVTVPRATVTIGTITTFTFHSFFSSLERSRLLLLLLLFIRVFHISVSWWSFTGDWVTASLLKSPGLFSVFWPFSIMLLSGRSPLGRQLPNPLVPLIIL